MIRVISGMVPFMQGIEDGDVGCISRLGETGHHYGPGSGVGPTPAPIGPRASPTLVHTWIWMSLSRSSLADCDASERGEGGGEEHAWMRISQGENGNREVHGKVGSKTDATRQKREGEGAGV